MTDAILVFFSILCLTQVIFHWFVFGKILTQKQKRPNTQTSVSVIIAAKNEAKHLPNLIQALIKQDHPNYEVIIVNDRSEDDSRTILQRYESEVDLLKVIHIDNLPQGWTGKKYALKKGIELSAKETLLFTDADCLPNSSQWIKEMTADSSEINIGYSPYKKRKGFLNHFIQFETLMTGLQYLGLALSGKPYMAVGRNWAIKKRCYPLDFLEEIKGIEGGDDDLLLNHLSGKRRIEVNIQPKSQTTSIPQETWADYFKQKIRHLSVGKHYHHKHQTILAIYTLSHLVGWFMFMLLLILSFQPYIILIIFGVRSLSFYTIFTHVGQKLGVMPNRWALPLLDLCYSIYYPLVGISAWSAKKIEWS